jgi:hypothetical protein
MRAGPLLLLAAIGASVGIASTPAQVRQDFAEQTAIPEHIVLETERQLDIFVRWARNDAEQPVAQPDPAVEAADSPL